MISNTNFPTIVLCPIARDRKWYGRIENDLQWWNFPFGKKAESRAAHLETPLEGEKKKYIFWAKGIGAKFVGLLKFFKDHRLQNLPSTLGV